MNNPWQSLLTILIAYLLVVAIASDINKDYGEMTKGYQETKETTYYPIPSNRVYLND